MSQSLSTSVGGATSNQRSIAASAGVGVLTAAIGYLVSYLLIASEAREAFENVAEWKAVTWYHFSGHFVTIESSGSFAGFSGTDTVNLIAESGSTNAQLLYIVPPLVLVLAGAGLAYHLRANNLGSAVVAGAPVAIGYGIVMTIAAIVSESSSEGTFFGIEASGSTAPELAPAILLAGVFYPLVFATVGAVLGSMTVSR